MITVKNDCVGYCMYHACELSIERLEHKKCAYKGVYNSPCKYLIKYNDHPYWYKRKVATPTKNNTINKYTRVKNKQKRRGVKWRKQKDNYKDFL